MHDIARHDMGERNLRAARQDARHARQREWNGFVTFSLARNRRRRADHGAQPRGRLARPEFLHERQQRGKHHHGGDHDGPANLAGLVVHQRQGKQQDRQRRSEEFGQTPQHALLLFVGDLIEPVLFEACLGLGGRQSGQRGAEMRHGGVGRHWRNGQQLQAGGRSLGAIGWRQRDEVAAKGREKRNRLGELHGSLPCARSATPPAA